MWILTYFKLIKDALESKLNYVPKGFCEVAQQLEVDNTCWNGEMLSHIEK